MARRGTSMCSGQPEEECEQRLSLLLVLIDWCWLSQHASWSYIRQNSGLPLPRTRTNVRRAFDQIASLANFFSIRGTISIGCSGTLFVACTGHDFQAFGLLDTAYRHTYTVPGRVKALIPKDTAFAEEGKTLVGGTDSGMAIVYDAESGKAIQNLEYPRGGLVQPVAVWCSCQTASYTLLMFSRHRLTRGKTQVLLLSPVRPSTVLPMFWYSKDTTKSRPI